MNLESFRNTASDLIKPDKGEVRETLDQIGETKNRLQREITELADRLGDILGADIPPPPQTPSLSANAKSPLGARLRGLNEDLEMLIYAVNELRSRVCI